MSQDSNRFRDYSYQFKGYLDFLINVMKYKNKQKKLEARIKHFETISKASKNAGAFTKPGSQKK